MFCPIASQNLFVKQRVSHNNYTQYRVIIRSRAKLSGGPPARGLRTNNFPCHVSDSRATSRTSTALKSPENTAKIVLRKRSSSQPRGHCNNRSRERNDDQFSRRRESDVWKFLTSRSCPIFIFEEIAREWAILSMIQCTIDIEKFEIQRERGEEKESDDIPLSREKLTNGDKANVDYCPSAVRVRVSSRLEF